MALGDPYCTPVELVAHGTIPVDLVDAEQAAVVSRACGAASRAVEQWCCRQFNKQTTATARVYPASGRRSVWVDDFHTTTGLAVASGTDGTYPTSVTGYDLEPFNGVRSGSPGWPFYRIVLRSGSFPCWPGRPTVQVTAQWGWAAVPDDVKLAALLTAARLFSRRDSQIGIVGFGEVALRVSTQIDPDVQNLLAPYRMPSIA